MIYIPLLDFLVLITSGQRLKNYPILSWVAESKNYEICFFGNYSMSDSVALSLTRLIGCIL